MEKKFIRFVCNTAAHPRGEKIKALNVISKIYDGEGNFLYVRKPHIKAMANQVEIDIDMIVDGVRIDYRQYTPLHHYKNDNGSIVKKSDIEIESIEAEIAQRRADKQAENDLKAQEKVDNEAVIHDPGKTDKDKITALIKLYKG